MIVKARLFSATIVALLSASMFILAFGVRLVRSDYVWAGTIYIRSDGSIEPFGAPVSTMDNITYTLTDNIVGAATSLAGAIVIERNNTVLDGAGYTLQGTKADHSKGIELTRRGNITIRNTNVTNFYCGVYLDSSSNNTVSGNNITKNWHGVWLAQNSKHNIVSDNVFVDDGLYVWESYENVVLDNLVNGKPLVYLEGVSDLEIEDAGQVVLISCNHIRLENLNLSHTDVGVELWKTNNTFVSGNDITHSWGGVYLISSSYNIVSDNNIANNGLGIWLRESSSNTFFHNDIKFNTYQNILVETEFANAWDDGYPSGGNYWSNYAGTDADHDGIGDTPYVIYVNNTDRYPLMGMFSEFNVTYFTPPLVSHTCNVTVISNSSISDFEAPIWIEHPEVIFLVFNVTGEQGATGFCRVSFPTDMMNGTYHVSVNGTEIPYTLLSCSDAAYSYLYFNYTHSTKEVVIMPEFPSFLILPLLFAATLLVVVVYRRKHVKRVT